MAYGLQVFNSSGFAQIDQDYNNYFVASRGSFTMRPFISPTPGWENSYNIIPITLGSYPSNVYPMLFVYLDYVGMYVGLQRILPSGTWSGSSWNTTAYFVIKGISDLDWPIKYMLALPSEYVNIPANPYGLRVYRSNGVIAFDSAMETPRISDILTTNGSSGQSVTYSGSNGPRYALLNGLAGTGVTAAWSGTVGLTTGLWVSGWRTNPSAIPIAVNPQ